MKVSFLLHLYQPPFQTDEMIRRVATESYVPLIKLIKANKFFHLTLNIPLSLLEHMDRLGYQDWINDVKSLIECEQIELTGSAAYHPLLTKISEKSATEQIILNEYGVGYYLGRTKGFDGEDVVMLKDVQGFFSPEMALNENLFELLESLAYQWVIGDVSHIHNINTLSALNYVDNEVYTIKSSKLKLVLRDTDLSTALAYTRNSDAKLLGQKFFQNHLVCLDGETFGHHNQSGIILLDNLIFYLRKHNYSFLKVNDYIKACDTRDLDNLNDSTWCVSQDNANSVSNPYYLWLDPNSKLQTLLYSVINIIDDNNTYNEGFTLDSLNKNIWKDTWGKTITNDDTSSSSALSFILALKCMNSDSLWNISNKDIGLGTKVFNTILLEEYLRLVELFISKEPLNSSNSDLVQYITEIRSLI